MLSNQDFNVTTTCGFWVKDDGFNGWAASGFPVHTAEVKQHACRQKNSRKIKNAPVR